MTYDELVAKNEELKVKIDELNQRLRFGAPGDIAGIDALNKMKTNLKLVDDELKKVNAAEDEPTPQEPTPQEPTPQEPTPQEPTPSTAPPAPPTDGDVLESSQNEQPEQQLGTA